MTANRGLGGGHGPAARANVFGWVGQWTTVMGALKSGNRDGWLLDHLER